MGPIIPRDPDPLPVCKGPEDKPIPIFVGPGGPQDDGKPFPGLIEPIEIPVRDMTEPTTIGDIRWL